MKNIIYLLIAAFFTSAAFGQSNIKNKIQQEKNSYTLVDKDETQDKISKYISDMPEENIDPYQFAISANIKTNKIKSAASEEQLVDNIIDETWNDEANRWDLDHKREYLYDANKNIVRNISYLWNEDSKEWVSQYKNEFGFDAYGNKIKDEKYSWDINMGMWKSSKYGNSQYVYSADGNILQEYYYSWNDVANVWDTIWKRECAYDENGNIILSFSYKWDNNAHAWVTSTKEVHNRDVNGNLTQNIYYSWDNTAHVWLNPYKTEYSYDTTNDISTHKSVYKRDEITNTWVIYDKNDNIYIKNGNITQNIYIYYDWDTITGTLVKIKKNESLCDSTNGVSNQTINYSWDAKDSIWIAKHKIIRAVNKDGKEAQFFYAEWDELTNKLVTLEDKKIYLR